MSMSSHSQCELCAADGGELIYRDDLLRVVLVDDALYPGFCRVIWNAHVREMSDLDAPQQMRLMQVVFTTESVLREVMRPDKINLASFGNMTPHLHWHVIPRYADDLHFPAAVWAAPQREPASTATAIAKRLALLPALRASLASRLASE